MKPVILLAFLIGSVFAAGTTDENIVSKILLLFAKLKANLY